MAEQLITCPNCGNEFEVGDVLTETIRGQLRVELEGDIVKKQEEVTKRLNEAKRKEEELAEKAESIDDAIAERLQAEKKKLAEAERKRAEQDYKAQLENMQEQIDERTTKLKEANKKEITLLQRQRELEEKAEEIDLEIERRLTEAQKELHEKAKKQALDEQELKMREKDNLISGLQKTVDDLKRRMEQGSQEAQGEALEGQLEDKLRAEFPLDLFEEVKKGAHGADIVQTVRDDRNRICGKILWEAKNTKNYQPRWIEKLRQDQMEKKADVAVLTSIALPPEIEQFGQSDSGQIWITGYGCAIALCGALRQQLMLVAREKLMVEHRGSVKDVLFDYVTGPEFGQRVAAVVDTYVIMQDDLESEKRSMKRIWKKREKQIEKVVDNLGGMRGELEGLVGSKALPEMETLELDHIAGEEYDEDEDTVEDDYEETAETNYEDDDDHDDEDETEDDDESEDESSNVDDEKWWLKDKKRGRN